MVDIASMAVGLEARSPLLDHELMEFAAQLPASLKLRGRTTKALYREALRGLVPDAILDREKMGFGVPLDAWLQRDLRAMAEDLVLSPRARQRGYFNVRTLEQLVREHMSGERPHGHHIDDARTVASRVRRPGASARFVRLGGGCVCLH